MFHSYRGRRSQNTSIVDFLPSHIDFVSIHFILRKHRHLSHAEFRSRCGYRGQQICNGIVHAEQLRAYNNICTHVQARSNIGHYKSWAWSSVTYQLSLLFCIHSHGSPWFIRITTGLLQRLLVDFVLHSQFKGLAP